MPTAPELNVLPEDILKVSRLNRQERKYLLKHLGESKRVVSEDPPGKPIEPYSMMAVLDRLRDEPKPTRDRITERIQASLEYDDRKHKRLETFGTVDYAAVGVGHEVAQTFEEQMFDVILTVRETPDGEDWASDFRAPGSGPVIADGKAFRDAQRIWCPWCDETHSGTKAMSGMGLHVYHKHREHKPEWDVQRKKIAKAWEQGYTFEDRDKQLAGENE